MENRKHEYIDSLRGIAILLVILVHASLITEVRPAMLYFAEDVQLFIGNGRFGVNLFFIVSAFTLMMSHQRRQFENNANRNFFIRRFFRIAPLYYLAIIFFTFVYYLGFDFENLHWHNIPKKELLLNIFFVNGFFPRYIHQYVPGGWSITVEFMFYAIFPFLFSKIKTVNKSIIFTLLSLLFSTFAYYILKDTSANYNNFLGLYIITQLPIFSLGMLAYKITTEKETKISLTSLATLAISILIYCYVIPPYAFIYSIVFFLLLVILAEKSYFLFSNKILAKIGKVSFSLYIMHFVVIAVANGHGWFSWINITNKTTACLYFVMGYFGLFLISFVGSLITHKFIEVPGQNLGGFLIKKLEQKKYRI